MYQNQNRPTVSKCYLTVICNIYIISLGHHVNYMAICLKFLYTNR